MLYRYIII